MERLGTYARVEPAGIRVPRWWCPVQRQSVSLLPSFLAARLSGTLAEVEDVVGAVEAAGGVTAAVEAVRPAEAADPVELPGALRWLRRRVAAVRAVLLAVVTLFPELFTDVEPTLAAMRERLGTDRVLERLRELCERHLAALPAPFGFRARARG